MNLLNHKYEDCRNMLKNYSGKKIPLRVYSNSIQTEIITKPKMFRVESLDETFVWKGFACCPYCAKFKALFDYALKK